MQHSNHKFEHLSSIYNRHVEHLRNEGLGLRKRLKELSALVTSVEINIERVTKAKEEVNNTGDDRL